MNYPPQETVSQFKNRG